MTLSAHIARRRLEAILLEDRILTPAQEVKDDAREALRRVRASIREARATGATP